MIYRFGNYSLDVDRQELRCGADLVPVEPKVLDLLQYLIRNRQRVVSKDDLIANVWGGRIVSESTLTSRIAATRRAIDDTGEQQRWIRTIARKGLRFIAEVRENAAPSGAADNLESRPTETAISQQEQLPPTVNPERRQLSIMAVDIGIGTLSERLDPEDLRQIVASCSRVIESIAKDHGGFVAKSAIDEALVYFGYPQVSEDDAERAVRAALATIRAVTDLRIDRLPKPLRARASVATGIVVVEADSVEGHRIVGGTAHLAIRLLSMADHETLVVSADTRRLIGGLFQYAALGAAKVRGATGPNEAFAILRERTTVSRFEALRSITTGFIGREEELELLLRRWNSAKSADGRVVLIWGEPGIGKSRLVATFQEAIKPEPQSCMSLFCSPHRSQTALYPVINELERAAGFQTNDTDATKLTKLEMLMAPSRGNVALLAELLSIDADGRYSRLSLSPQRRKELLFECTIDRIVSRAATQPVLICLEDAHWLDPTTRELFDIIVDRVRNLAVLVVLTYRPEFIPPWMGQAHVSVLTLNRLGPRESALMISRVAGTAPLPADLLNQIASRTEGVPLFIEEMTKSVLESGHTRNEASAFAGRSDPLKALAVPATLQASLVARLDRISHVRAVAQGGAALGREFSFELLKAVLHVDDSELAPLVEKLVFAELLHQRGAVPNSAYAFKHALVQDAVYETLLKTERVRLQKRVVEAFENGFPDMAERNPDVLAYHCAEAELWEKAISYRLRSVRAALDRSAPLEAQSQLEQGKQLLPRITQDAVRKQFEGCLEVATGGTLAMTKGFASPEVASALSKAIRLLDEPTHRSEYLNALGGLFQYHLIRSESPKGLALARQFLGRDIDKPTEVLGAFIRGTSNLHIGNFQSSLDDLTRARSAYDEETCRSVAFAGGPHVGSFILVWSSLASLFLGSVKEARTTISAAIADARTRLHPFTLVSALLAQARFFGHTRDLEGAIAAAEEGLALAIEQRSPYHIARAGILQAWNVVESGRPHEGIALMELALARQHETGGNFLSSYNLSCLAQAHARTGNLAKAAELANESVEEVRRTGEHWWTAEAERIKGEILLAASPDDTQRAEACFRQALAIARRQRAKLWELHSSYSLAALTLRRGRHAEARDLLIACDAFPAEAELAALVEARRLLDNNRPRSTASSTRRDG